MSGKSVKKVKSAAKKAKPLAIKKAKAVDLDKKVEEPIKEIKPIVPKKPTIADLYIPGTSILDKLQIAPIEKKYLYQPAVKKEKKKKRRQADDEEIHEVTNEVEVLLDNSFTKIDHVPGLKTTLYPHQQTAIKNMLDLEYGRTISMSNTGKSLAYNIVYNVGVLSEPVGSGKTIDIISIILLNKVPRAIGDISILPNTLSNSRSMGYVRRRFRKFLSPTIIFVGVSVMKQWQLAFETFTDMKVYAVHSVFELRPMLEMMVDGLINQYDVILVKNGKITVDIELPGDIELEPKNAKPPSFIYNVIANMRAYCWARIVIDDFDTIKLPPNAGIVNGIFTWYVSSTRKQLDTKHFNSPATGTSATDLLKKYDHGCGKIMYNHFMFRYLNIRNEINYLKSTTNMPNPKFHMAVFKNTNDKIISILAGMNDDAVNKITEMLNGDAVGQAAEAAGIKSTRVVDIFEKILGAQFKQFRMAGDLLAFIDHLRDTEQERLPMKDNPDPEDTYGKKDLLKFREIEYKYPGVNSLLKDTEEEYTMLKHQTGATIDRVKDNIRHGDCPVCQMSLQESTDTIISKCCGAIFCGSCGSQAQNMNDRYNKLKGRCSNCRTEITFKDLIYIEKFDLSKITEEEFEDEDEAPALPIKPIIKRKDKPRTKYTAIVDIILGQELPESKRVDMYIPNLMKGGAYPKEAKIRKVLIFANFEETLEKVIEELNDEKIHYWRLMGTANEINDTMLAFNKCPTTCAMVINSTKYCAGLNLQPATDLVFAHNIIDPSIKTQVTGRGQRLGRKSPLNIWFILYDNEVTEMVATHGVRDLTMEELKTESMFEAGTEHTAITDVKDNTADCYLDKPESPDKKSRKQRYERNAEEDDEHSASNSGEDDE